LGRTIQHLLDVDIHLTAEGRGDHLAVAFVSQDGHAMLDAERLENGLGDPERQTVERPMTIKLS